MFVLRTFSQDQHGWKYVGPKSNSYQFKGLFTAVWADENDLNTVMAGSENGGLFITKNALADQPTWKNLTDNLPYMNFGVSGIVVRKNTDNKEIYISTCTAGGLLTKSFGNGVLHSLNGGETWEHIGPSGTNDHNFPLQGMVANMANQDQMIAFNGRDLYITHDAWKTFYSAKLPFHAEIQSPDITEVEFAPYEEGTFYVCTRTGGKNLAQLFVTHDEGKTWKDITPPEIACERIAIATINDPKFKGKFYVTSGNTAIYVHYFNGKEFSKPLNTQAVTHMAASSLWCLELTVNQVDSSVIYLSLTETSMSLDGGKSFVKIAHYNGANTHGDVRDMIIAKNTPHGKEDKILLANDGGISLNNKLFYPGVQFRSLNGPGLEANMFWGIDAMQSDSLFVAGGAQDNGGFFIKEKQEDNNLENCGDGYYALTLNDSMALNQGNPPLVLLHNTKHNSNTYIYIPDANCEVRRPMILKDSFVYFGYHDIWQSKVRDLIAVRPQFKNISHMKDVKDGDYLKNREIKALCISKFNTALVGYNNPQYNAPQNSGKLYYCADIFARNPEYIDVSAINANAKNELCRWWNAESFAADEFDKNSFYMVYKDPFDHHNSGVFKFTYFPDSNKAELKELTYNLERVGFNKVKVDKQSGVVYVAANNGAFYLNEHSGDTVWKSLNVFPKVIVTDIVFNYYTNQIYVATFGRGIWTNIIPSFNNNEVKISSGKVEKDPVKVDGALIVGVRKEYTLLSKLILTKGSKIELRKDSKLIISSSEMVRNEKNEVIDINPYLQAHKTAQLIFLKK
jgi:photosystem II stability/assembly factor-like uncharacterized protein